MSEEDKLEFNNQLDYIKQTVLQAKTTIDIVQKNTIEIFANENIYKQIVANEELDVALADGSIVPNFAKFKKMFLEVQAPDSAKLEGSSKSELIEEVSSMINEASSNYHDKNYLINGYFLVWQERTVKPVGYGYVADMWLCYRGEAKNGATVSMVSGRKPKSYAMRLQRDVGNDTTYFIGASQAIESIRTADLAGERVTLSFYARCGSGYSGDNTSFRYCVRSRNDATDTNMIGSGLLLGEVITKPTTEWTLYTTTLDIPVDSTQLSAFIYYTPSGVAGNNDYIEIADVVLNKGAKRVESNDTYEDTLRDCQRYYEKTNGTSSFKRVYNTSDTTKLLPISCDFKVTKRTTPTMTVVGRVSDGENFTSWEGGMSLCSDYFSAYKFISPSGYLDFSYYIADARL